MAFLQNLFGFGESKKAHEQFYGNEGYRNDQQQPHHKASFTHELVSGAAGFAGKDSYYFYLNLNKASYRLGHNIYDP
jgi:hypothetical protein